MSGMKCYKTNKPCKKCEPHCRHRKKAENNARNERLKFIYKNCKGNCGTCKSKSKCEKVREGSKDGKINA